MHFPLGDLDPRSFWIWLPFISKLFTLFLVLISVFVIFRLLDVFWTTRRLQRTFASGLHQSTDLRSVRVAEHRLANLGQLLLFTSYLFGFCFFFELPAAFVLFGDSKTLPFERLFRQLGIYFVYAAEVFLVLLFLHSLRWAASSWFYRVSGRLL